MKKVNEKVTLFLPQDEIEPQAFEQIMNISKMDPVFGIAVMPDCHLGKGATVGSVIATQNAVIPAAVGVDLGCGMIAVKTKFFKKDLEPYDLSKIREGIERRIPLGAGAFNTKVTPSAQLRIDELIESARDIEFYDSLGSRWREAVGTLGSGNHFIEISLDEEDRVWVVLHSGSRGIGNKIAQYHIKLAQKFCSENNIELPDPELAYFVAGNEDYENYIKDVHWAQRFAWLNRDEMMDRVLTELSYTLFGDGGHEEEIEVERINCHHNFTQIEEHQGNHLLITRKGAIEAKLGQKGFIPGSMGTRSYVVSGLGNEDSYCSAPHGAGRKMSRNEAKRQFTLQDLEKSMGTIEFRHSEKLIDEIPMSYKDIEVVMKNSSELVKVEHILSQLMNVKGN
jgi:tRNA-splicing ligase RtcB